MFVLHILLLVMLCFFVDDNMIRQPLIDCHKAKCCCHLHFAERISCHNCNVSLMGQVEAISAASEWCGLPFEVVRKSYMMAVLM